MSELNQEKKCCEQCRENPPSGDDYCTAKGCPCHSKEECEHNGECYKLTATGSSSPFGYCKFSPFVSKDDSAEWENIVENQRSSNNGLVFQSVENTESKEKCEDYCGGTNIIIDCHRCGAPVCCDDCCRGITAQLKVDTKPEEWEKEFEKEFDAIFKGCGVGYGSMHVGLKRFISNLLTHTRLEERAKIIKIVEDMPNSLADNHTILIDRDDLITKIQNND